MSGRKLQKSLFHSGRCGPGIGPVLVTLLLAGACKSEKASDPKATSPKSSPSTAPLAPDAPDPDGLPEVENPESLPPERRAIQFVHGKERVVDTQAALEKGLTIVDLSDGWAPRIFQDAVDPEGKPLINRYRQVFVGMANDKTDGDGQPIEPGQKNYLELLGVPPSLSVLRDRFLDDEKRECSGVNLELVRAVDRVTVWSERSQKEAEAQQLARRKRLEKAMATAGVADVTALVTAEPKWERDVKAAQKQDAERAAFSEVEKRMLCEGRMDAGKHKAGIFDPIMASAVVAFQMENMLLDLTEIQRSTLETMERSPLANNYEALRRTIRERVARAGGVLEDGSVDPGPGKDGKPRTPRYTTRSGEELPVPNLVEAALSATLARLGLDSPEAALAFFKRHSAKDFSWLKVAVRFPELPEYYSAHMDFEAEVDRGDVWYELPFDAKGNRLPQARRILPSLTLFVRWQGKRIPLVKWRTTIGGWRTEMGPDGHDYLRYKGSDVGPRVWRHIVASPVWIPPESTPLGGMIKKKYINGQRQWVTNYDEVGPGYLSAYGLAMAIHVEQRKHADGHMSYFDNGIRVHGSSDYRSLRGRFSHGCHRLYNNLAVRLFDHLLAHRTHRIVGPARLDFRRRFLREGRVFDMRLPVRGFYFELDPSIPVETLEGNIKGDLKKPFESFVFRPGVEYPTTKPPPVPKGLATKAGGGGDA